MIDVTTTNRRVAAEELPNLDSLRALAVLLVFADHVLQTFGMALRREFHPYDWYLGRLGVLLFFVHTCLVLMASMERLGAGGCELTRVFYIRRAFRIYPLAIVCILLVVLVGVPRMPWESFEAPGLPALASNLALTLNITGTEPVIGPLWSLPVEVQMYLVLPALFLATQRATDLIRIGIVWLLALGAAAVLPAVSEAFRAAQFAPCFVAGIVAFALRKRISPRLPALLWPLFLAALVLAYIGVEQLTPGIHHVALQSGICLVVGFCIPLFAQSDFAPLNRATHLVAKYSYGIYLFHCVALWAGFYAIRTESILLSVLITLMVLVAMSVASYHLLEAPAIRLGARLSRRRAAIVALPVN